MNKGEDLTRISKIEKTFQKTNRIDHQFYGTVQLYQDPMTKEEIICFEKLKTNRQSLMDEIEKIKIQIFNKNEYLIQPIDFSIVVQKTWCSTQYILRIFQQNPKTNLTKIFNLRKCFSMPDITHLFYQMIILNEQLQSKGILSGDIHSDSIFQMDTNLYKLLKSEFNQSVLELNRQRRFMQQPIFVSPKVYETLQKQYIYQIKHDQAKSDCFSLGLVILQAGLGKSIQNIYGTQTIEEKILKSYIDEFEVQYVDNPLIVSSLKKMLELDEEYRIDFKSLMTLLPSYESVKEFFKKNQSIKPAKKSHVIYRKQPESFASETFVKQGTNLYQQIPLKKQKVNLYQQIPLKKLPNEPLRNPYNTSFQQKKIEPYFSRPNSQHQQMYRPTSQHFNTQQLTRAFHNKQLQKQSNFFDIN